MLEDDPYQIDLKELEPLLEIHNPELVVLGKSMIIYREPVREIVRMISGMKLKPIIHYDKYSSGAVAYELLAQEFLARLDGAPPAT